MPPRKFDLRKAKVKLAISALILNALILATFLTSSPQVSPASGWIVVVNRVLYKTNLKSYGGLARLHAAASSLSKEDCIACHGTMKSSRLALHKIHLTSDLLPGLSCTNCHDRIAMKPKPNQKVVHMVNVGFCKKCHSKFPGGTKNSAMKATDAQADCTTCHSGTHAFRHAQPYLSQIVSARECLGCHGGRILPWTSRHERDDWVAQHGKEALGDSGKCMKCHEYGLAFCNECHQNKPPSHRPRERWLATHKKAAKAETRACFTCHKASFCEKCHVNHTRGWRYSHARVVVKTGSEVCQNCHNSTFCESCHVGTARSRRWSGIKR